MEYQAKMVNLVKVLLKILRQGLPESWNCAPDVLDVLTENASIPMRMLHYAPQPVRDDKQFGGICITPTASGFYCKYMALIAE